MNPTLLIIDADPTNCSNYVKSWHNDHSDRMSKSLFIIDCSAFINNELTLIEQMLGYVKGYKQRPTDLVGYFEMANGGTILFNNFESLSEEAQIKIKDYIRTGKVIKMGSHIVKRIDVQFWIGLSEPSEIVKSFFPNHNTFNLGASHV